MLPDLFGLRNVVVCACVSFISGPISKKRIYKDGKKGIICIRKLDTSPLGYEALDFVLT